MKAIRLNELEGPEALSYEDVPDPEPGSGEIVVRLRNAALNRRDVFVTQGMYPGAKPDALPITLGSDGSGEGVGVSVTVTVAVSGGVGVPFEHAAASAPQASRTATARYLGMRDGNPKPVGAALEPGGTPTRPRR